MPYSIFTSFVSLRMDFHSNSHFANNIFYLLKPINMVEELYNSDNSAPLYSWLGIEFCGSLNPLLSIELNAWFIELVLHFYCCFSFFVFH